MIKKLFPLLTILAIGILLAGCSGQSQKSTKDYVANVDQWHQKRIQSLKQEDSWLSLAGLYQIDDGTHTFGSDSTNDIVFPPKAPAQMGTVSKEGNQFSFDFAAGVNVTQDGSAVSQLEISHSDQNESRKLRHGSLLWYIIERRGNYYIRLKDTKHPNFANFDGIDRFPVSKNWRVKATFDPFEEPKTITIPDIMGDTYQDSLYGTLQFSIDGQQYSLAPLGHPQKDEEFFIIFGDNTNGNSTYSGGRYFYAPTPDKNGGTYIDFNKAYNPPCVFTDFATCPLPPEQNRLDLNITAGEKMYR